MSSVGFAAFAVILASNIPLVSDLDEAYNLAQRSLDVLRNFGSTKKQWLPRVYLSVYGTVFPWKIPLQSCREPLWKAYRVWMRTGDIEFGMMGGLMHAVYGVYWGLPLYAMAEEFADLRKNTQAHGVDLVCSVMAPLQQYVANMRGESKDVFRLTGEFMDEREETKSLPSNMESAVRLNIALLKCVVAAHMGHWELAESSYREITGIDQAWRSSLAICSYHFFGGMTAIAMLRKYGRSRKRYRTFRRSCREIQKMTRNCPSNFYMMQNLVEAEESAWLGNLDVAVNRYEHSIAASHKDSALCYEAIATARLACTLDEAKGRSVEVRESYTKAWTAYKAWGAKVKVDQLDQLLADRGDFVG